MDMTNTPNPYLLHALALAKSRRGFCAPNPAVGAVVVKDQQVMAEGCHWACGEPHAEAQALASLTPDESADATLYVTLEPCNHWGRTAPCTEQIIESGVTKVVYAYADPNAIATGGAARLREAGIECEQQTLPDIDVFYRSYAHWLSTNRPWVTCKLAVTLNGKIADADRQPVAITGPELAEYTHRRRLHSDAILTTVETVIQDDPRMNVRIGEHAIEKPVYVLDTHLRIPDAARIFQTASQVTLFHGSSAPAERLEAFEHRGVHCQEMPETEPGRLDLEAVLGFVGDEEGRHDLWVEAGGECFSSFQSAKLAQSSLIYIAPKTISTASQEGLHFVLDFSKENANIAWTQWGDDVVCEITH